MPHTALCIFFTVFFFFWGSESEFKNTLKTAWGTNTELNEAGDGGPVSFPGFGSPLAGLGGVQNAIGPVDISFDGQTSNTDPSYQFQNLNLGPAAGGRSIALAYLDPLTGLIQSDASDYVLFALDDSPDLDEDHDDYVGIVRASPVPIPAALPLFLSALAALGILGHRKHVASKSSL